jgi:transketolase
MIEQQLLHNGTTYLYTLQGKPKIIQLNEIIGMLSENMNEKQEWHYLPVNLVS